jgi:hypothetical protein
MNRLSELAIEFVLRLPFSGHHRSQLSVKD